MFGDNKKFVELTEKELNKISGGKSWFPIVDGIIDAAQGFWDSAKSNKDRSNNRNALDGKWF